MDLGLQGRTALVVAASRGLGKACAHELASEGASVAITSRNPEQLAATAQAIQAATGSEVIAIACDLTDHDQLHAMYSEAERRLGQIDVLVTNSGPPPAGRFDALTDEDWLDAFSLVAMPVIRLIRYALPGMRERGWGRVIAIQSTSIKQPIPHLALSNGIRPGIQGILKPLAESVGRDGVTVNTVLPGMFLTDRLIGDLQRSADEEGIDLDTAIANAGARNPVGRVGRPEELASLVAYLASERASYITGACVQADGGSVRALA